MTNKEQLDNYQNISRKALSLEIQAQRMEEDKEMMIDEIDAFINKLDERKRELLIEKVSIEESISNISDDLEREILNKRYILGMTWDEISQSIGYSLTRTHQLHRKALENIKLSTP